jgi:hypothetical protein
VDAKVSDGFQDGLLNSVRFIGFLRVFGIGNLT